MAGKNATIENITEPRLPSHSVSCGGCKHLDLHTAFDEPYKCAAFPDGIPDEIWLGENDHRNPYPGDHGLQYERRRVR